MSRSRCWLLFLAGLVIFLAPIPGRIGEAAPSHAALSPEKLDRLQEQLDGVKVQIDFMSLKVKDTRTHVRKLENQSSKKQERITALQAETAALASEAATVAERVVRLSREMTEGKAKIEAIRQRFRNRLVHLHKIRQGTLVTSIISAGDLNSFLNRFQMVRHLLEADRRLMDALRVHTGKLEKDSAALATEQKHLEELSALNRNRQEELAVEMSSLSAMLETLLLERKVFLARQGKLNQSRQALEQEIVRIEAARSRNPATAGEFEESPGRTTRPTPDPPPGTAMVTPASGSVAANPGRLAFQWPVKKVQLLSFQPTGEGAPPGLEIIVSGETEVLAAARGKVKFKGPLGQFGNMVILGHNKGFSTVYGHLDDIWVGLDQVVEQGEVLGRLLVAHSPRLHFEIRFAGKNQEPLSFLPSPR